MKNNKILKNMCIAIFSIMSTFLLVSAVSAASFTDVKDDYWAKDPILFLHDEGIITGKTETRFDPAGNITREQAATMLVRALYPNESSAGEIPFIDVKEESFYYHFIVVALKNEIITGYTDNTFRGKNPITRAETAEMINNAYTLEKGNHVQ